MKLRNKKTGEIKEVEKGHFLIVYKDDYEATYVTSLAELCEEWEDYEEPEDFWYIDPETGIMLESTNPELWDKKYAIDSMKSYGNYFETKEEAELAVKKLEAWKRLKDKGFRFKGGDDARISYEIDWQKWGDEDEMDFELLFGGEE